MSEPTETPISPPPPPTRDDRIADWAFAITTLGLLILAALLYFLFHGVAVLLFFSAILAYALLPVVDRLDVRHVPRTVAVLAVALIGAGLVTLIVAAMAPAVAVQLAELPEMLERTRQQAMDLWWRVHERLPESLTKSIDRALGNLPETAQKALPSTETMTDWASRAASGLTALASALLLVPVFVFLMLRGYHPFMRAIRDLIPPRWRPRFDFRGAQADSVLSGFIRGQLVVAAVIGALYAIGFSIVGIPLGLVVGILAGFGELIPFVGGAIALVLASILALAGGQPLDVLWVLAIFAVVQGLEGALISPWIVGRKVELGPAIVIVALAVGGELFGFIGLLAAVPAAALIKVAAKAARDAYQASPFFRRRATV